MKEQVQTYLLGFVALMTVVNTVLIVTDDDGGRVIQPVGAAMNSNDDVVSAQTTIDRSKYLDQAEAIKNDPAAFAETPAPPPGPKTTVSFAQTEHNFGNITQESENKHVFEFTNTGSEPLIISDAKGSCGCTVPNYPREPIPPGETGEIEVVYSPGKQKGNQTKTVTVTANTDPPTSKLQIRAMVEEI